jgi:uncharacterized protein (TIGR01777 family)
MKKNILITGASGFVGQKIIELIDRSEYNIRILSRKPSERTDTFLWDPKNGEIEDGALDDLHTIIHLAGAGIADQRWTANRKKEILSSRVDTLNLIHSKLNHDKKITLISTSAVGYYGAQTSEFTFSEDDLPFGDFISNVCVKWEESALNFKKNNHRVAILRVGIVLGKGGALNKMILPVKLNLGSPIGGGNQYMPWIHLDDLARMYLFSIKNNLDGIYNAVAPEHINNRKFLQTLAQVLGKKFFMPKVPKFVLFVLFGEMAKILIEGSKVSSEKIIKENFEFKHENVRNTLIKILTKN